MPHSLVVLIGASGSGKSYWAHGHFRETQVVSSDRCRALVSDDEQDQQVSREAFTVFYTIIRQRMSLGRLTVADSTGLHEFSRRRLVLLAREHDRPVHAVAFDTPREVILQQNEVRTRRVPEEVLLRHAEQFQMILRSGTLAGEGFDSVYYLSYPYGAESTPEIAPPQAPEPLPETRSGGTAGEAYESPQGYQSAGAGHERANPGT